MLGGDQLNDPAELSNAPDPVRHFTVIHFRSTGDTPTGLYVYDVLGRRVRELMNRPLPGGEHRVNWDCRDDEGQAVSSGVYFIKLQSGIHRSTEKVLVVK